MLELELQACVSLLTQVLGGQLGSFLRARSAPNPQAVSPAPSGGFERCLGRLFILFIFFYLWLWSVLGDASYNSADPQHSLGKNMLEEKVPVHCTV